MTDAIQFVAMPAMPDDPEYKHKYLLLNPCDGYRIAEFRGGEFWVSNWDQCYPREALIAWARLPCSLEVGNRFST